MVANDLHYFPLEHGDATPPAGPRTPRRRPVLFLGALFLVGSLAGGAGGAIVISRIEQPAAAAGTAAGNRQASNPVASTGNASAAAATSAAAIYQQDAPSVVTISTTVQSFRGVGQGTGSGVVVDDRGDIVTNAHVVSGAQQITVTFSNGQTVPGTVAGIDSNADLAVVRVSAAASSLHPITLGDSSTVRVGDTVYAIGSPFGLSGTFTHGLVSGVNRTNSGARTPDLTDLIQTDAAINPGNSGGALLNSQGALIGINESIDSPVDGNVGVGFAIPINQVKSLLSSLEQGMNQ
jgi:putative serine protease PepD